jgi:hypothetical protein
MSGDKALRPIPKGREPLLALARRLIGDFTIKILIQCQV